MMANSYMACPPERIARAWQKLGRRQMPEIEEQFQPLPENAIVPRK
jgi:hypothetical protein